MRQIIGAGVFEDEGERGNDEEGNVGNEEVGVAFGVGEVGIACSDGDEISGEWDSGVEGSTLSESSGKIVGTKGEVDEFCTE